MSNSKKIPEPYDKSAPSYSDDEPEKLLQFLDHMERMMEIAGTVESAKNAFVVRYVERRVAEQWKKFDSFTESYIKFKKEILENYPDAKNSERGSIKKLKNILNDFDAEEIGLGDSEELMKLIRAMKVEVDKLLKSGLITDREAVPLFMEKLTPGFREQVIFRIDMAREQMQKDAAANPANNANPQDAGEASEKGYTFAEVVTETRSLARKNDARQEYMTSVAPRAKGKGRSMTPERHPKLEENSAATTKLLEEMKLTLVNMRDRMDVSDKRVKEDIEQIRQLYKSVPARMAAAAQEAQSSMPPRQEVRFSRPPGMPQNDLCHYCRMAGHFMGACPYRRRHIEEGKIKTVGMRDFFPDGTPLPMGGTKPRSQIVEETKPPVTSQVNYASTFVQQAGDFQQGQSDDWTPYEEDAGEYTYYDPREAQNNYDPRDDEILSLRVEQQKLIQQLVQHQQAPRRVVQPTPKIQTPVQVDQNMLATLVAAVRQLDAEGGEGNPTESQFTAGTRANPSRTGNGAGREGF